MNQISTPNQFIYLKDYQKPHFVVESIELFFNIEKEVTTVTALQNLKRQGTGPLLLNGEELELVSIKINGQELAKNEFEKTEETLKILNPPDQFKLEVITLTKPHLNTSLDGLYKSKDFLVTQCEAEGFRKITYFMDRPDVMTKYTVTIEADATQYPILLSNGDRQWKKDLGNGRHQVQWKDPFNKPCYLFALVAGDLGVIKDTFKTMTGKSINLEIYASHGKQDRCHHAMVSLKKSMEWDEQAFGREYDLNDYMIVAIDDFNAGAMENKGLNIFNAKYILADSKTATDLDFDLVESVVAHEYFHNWTGNRITCRDWFQLSLKEGLTVYRDQEFSADMGSREVKRIEDVVSLRNRQFSEDAGPNAHPVRPTKAMSVDNFFTATIYEKGAELIRMMQTMTGKKNFRKGMDRYFELYDGQAVTTEDFVHAISSANGLDWTLFKNWYDQAGTPVVEVTEKYLPEQKVYELHFKQSCPPTPEQETKKPFHIPIKFALLDPSGKEIPINSPQIAKDSEGNPLINLTQASEVYKFENMAARPVPSLLRGFSAPVHLKWDVSDETLLFLLKHDQDGFNRWEALQTLTLKYFEKLISRSNESRFKIPDSYFEAFDVILKDEHIPAGFKAKLLELPSDEFLIQMMPEFSSEEFFQARQELEIGIAQKCHASLLKIYEQYHNKNLETLNAKVFGERQLKNIALIYLAADEAASDFKKITTMIWDQFSKAANMTDKMWALSMMNDSENEVLKEMREKALTQFFEEWKDDTLVLDKWFGIQARSLQKNTFERVKALTKHSHFDYGNPNKIYALLRTFSGVNLIRFNDERYDAYDFLADEIIKIDEKNPQVASRLCAAFNPWKKLTPDQQKKAKASLEKILKFPKLSKNSKELILKSLGS
jgi:aminopeptidase N